LERLEYEDKEAAEKQSAADYSYDEGTRARSRSYAVPVWDRLCFQP
jgi:hypothetical protein